MNAEIFLAPWKITNEIRRVIWLPFIWLYFAIHGIRWGQRWRIFGSPLIQRYRGSHITIGDDLQMRNWLATNPLGPNHRTVLATRSPDAKIEIGDGARLTA